MDTDRDSERLGKESNSHLCAEAGVFIEDGSLVYMSSQTPRNKVKCLAVFPYVTYALKSGVLMSQLS